MVALHLALLLSLGQFLPDGMQAMPPRAGAVSAAVFRFAASSPGAFSSPVTADTGQSMTFARASTATYLTGSTMATASNDQLRVDLYGLLNEPARTNYALQNADLSNAAWLNDGTQTTTANTCPGPTSATNMALVDSTGSAGVANSRYQSLVVPSGTQFVGSAWFTPQSGSHTGTVFINNLAGGVPLGCTCATRCLTGGASACATTVIATACFAYATFSGLCRLDVLDTASAATTAINFGAGAGQYNASKDVLCIGYGQPEVGTFGTSTIVTAGTAAARALETATVPAVGAINATAGACVWNWTPEHSSATAGADRVQLSTTGLVAKWVNGSTAVSVTIGGATATTSALAFAAFTTHQVRTRWGGLAGSGACVQVDNGTEVCGGTYSAITPTNPLYIGGDASGGGGASISGLKCCPGNSACN